MFLGALLLLKCLRDGEGQGWFDGSKPQKGAAHIYTLFWMLMLGNGEEASCWRPCPLNLTCLGRESEDLGKGIPHVQGVPWPRPQPWGEPLA